jgi:ABC-2 type transport system ATP-binding protein
MARSGWTPAPSARWPSGILLLSALSTFVSLVLVSLVLVRLSLVGDFVAQRWVVFEAWIHGSGLHDPGDLTDVRDGPDGFAAARLGNGLGVDERGGVVWCEHLGKSFGETLVVDDVSLRVEAGTIVGLIGPSGSGKTTMVRLLTGLYEPTAGAAEIGGTPATALSHRQRSELGYLPQVAALFPELSLWENLSFHASMYGLRLRRRRRLRQLLDWVELDEHREKRVREASGGMQRRLALACSLVHDPSLVFLDEPTAGIDPILRAKFWDRFRELRDSGRTLIVTTQYVGEAAYCDVVGVLSEGRLVLYDTPDRMRRAAFGGDVLDIELDRAVTSLDALTRLDTVLTRPDPTGPTSWQVLVTDGAVAEPTIEAALAEAEVGLVAVRERPVDFDAAFVRLIERHRTERAVHPAASG